MSSGPPQRLMQGKKVKIVQNLRNGETEGHPPPLKCHTYLKATLNWIVIVNVIDRERKLNPRVWSTSGPSDSLKWSLIVSSNAKHHYHYDHNINSLFEKTSIKWQIALDIRPGPGRDGNRRSETFRGLGILDWLHSVSDCLFIFLMCLHHKVEASPIRVTNIVVWLFDNKYKISLNDILCYLSIVS